MYINVRAARVWLALLALGAPLSQADARQVGLLVVAHGATADWNAQVRGTVAQVTWRLGPTATAFLMGPEAQSAGWDSAVARLTSAGVRSVVVVPLMVSSFGSHYRQVRYYAGELDRLPAELAGHDHASRARPAVPMQVTPALDAAPELLEAVANRWSALDLRLRTAPLVLLGHGPNDETDAERWTAAFHTALARVRQLGHSHESRSALLRDDAAPSVRADAIRRLRDSVTALADRAGDSVTVMTVLVARGEMTGVRIPKDLDGLPIRYVPTGLTPLPAIARWIERVAGEAIVKTGSR
ncbi:MAG TPA: CbiX/SirB N-terminal domain-containing protein [Gemmatimonadales bacterium]